jgi:osmotically inducible lipoprotein OsmB
MRCVIAIAGHGSLATASCSSPILISIRQLEIHTMSRSIATTLVFAGLALVLVGCGYSPGDRAASGGLIGAGAGAGIAAVTGGSPLTGALVGGAVGAVGGAVTSHNDVNLGRPIWR